MSPGVWRTVARTVWRPALVVAAAALLGWWLVTFGPLYESEPEATNDAKQAEATDPAPGWTPRPRTRTPEPGCTPRASAVCLSGDAWWVDGCGEPHERKQDCELRPCVDGACEADDAQCVDAELGWRCEGDVARGCSAGRYYEIDCAAQGRRCVMTEDGPACREPTPDDCDEPGSKRCEGNELLACVEGRWARFDCTIVGGRCMPGRGGAELRCVRFAEAEPGECGPCGCPPSFEDEERCDGKDNDGDNFVDEGVDCGVIDIVAFVVVDDDGMGAFTDEDLESAVARLNRWYAREDDLGLQFRLADVIAWGKEDWLSLQGNEIDEALHSTVIERDEHYIPIIFTEELLVDEVPRPGLATPPNGSCGGQRRVLAPQVVVGGVVIAKRRWDTTIAHEVGHYLGLCHTHMEDGSAVEVYEGSGDDAQACEEPCALQGDGICDTPIDPGPPVCSADEECAAVCESGERPDPRNVMAYYPDCRSMFTPEQARRMRTSLALRRGWHRCAQEPGCACRPGAGDCPEQMSCRRYEAADGAPQGVWQCGLDGPVLPGGPCDGPDDCSQGATCMQLLGDGAGADGSPRCVRPCVLSESSCDCQELGGIDVPFCMDDLPG